MSIPGTGRPGKSIPGNPLSSQSVLGSISGVAQAAAAQAVTAMSRAPGIDDWTCRPSPEHPRPVVLVHGTFGNAQDYWITTAPMLVTAGYCVFRLDYGAMPDVPVLHGIGPIERGAEELAEFVDKVLNSTGADKVDIVGHSQGGMMPRYYLKFLGGASKVNQLIALAPSNHGTTMNGLFLLASQFPNAAELMRNNFPPGCSQQETGCAFITKLNEGGDTVPGVHYTVIATKYDEVVTPYQSCFLDGPDVRNILLQDLYPANICEHVSIAFDPMALREVLKQLGTEPTATR
ncbi:MAG TPA: alpha/beta fold hydrolase [Amycolatopsis sp.]|jgi:triacylglycerol esterase/lipase EstA (alpha/beta hydrolase family)|nr:alpha/beta fold hydrolase [Amycolatopsis sp.]